MDLFHFSFFSGKNYLQILTNKRSQKVLTITENSVTMVMSIRSIKEEEHGK